ncbi:maleylpyruvate isomerase family mycothiol-dependent enzyme [Streptacidiphilus carbonis]|uniref:maleylpyruvate isomerase family mycothiol-dependent enzyme n=1 Tax=Streptacidiphilus carbonis TaxID=105422 RepID=UPI0005AB747E|nr:maleylpyruvate isomerase family mycothiol-dependent enzyme [Streptacidiphilus carbonis]
MTTPAPAAPSAPEQLYRAITGTAADIAALLSAGADPEARVPRSTWNLGEAAAHLALANQLMAELAAGAERPYGDGTPDGLAAANADSLAAFTERDPAVLAAAVVEQAESFVAAAAGQSAALRVLAPMGPMDLDTLGSYLLTHMLGHGWDLARALRRPHMIDRQRVELCLPFLTTAMPRVLDRKAVGRLSAVYELRLRGGGPRYTAAFADGGLTVSGGAAQRADCTIVTEPVTFLLIALGRCSPWGAMARGGILAWGRRPLLAPAFPSYFRAP